MSRRSRRKHETSPSLFPFLAVLICTMGAIIVLLVLVVKHADVQATAATETNEQDLVDRKSELRDSLELEADQTETLKELRPELKERLEKEKTEYGHLADHVSRLKEELKRLKQNLAAIEQESDRPASFEARQEIEKLKLRIAEAKMEFEKRKQVASTAKPAYSIIPRAKGGNGTYRRPIFVECDATGVTLQPYGITLKPDDFPSTLGPGNPLDRALLMIRDYWNQIDPSQKEGQPYPLFVVRPSGSRAFAASRKAMKSWVDEFGYELVGGDVQLDYPKPDPAFQERLLAAVEQARLEQQVRATAMSRQQVLDKIRRLESSGGSQGFRASSTGGGFVPESGSRSGSSVYSAASQSRSGTNTSFASQSGSGRTGSSSFASSGTGNRNSFSGSSQTGNGQSFNPSPSSRNSTFQGSNRGTGGGSGGTGSGPTATSEEFPPESLARVRGKDWALPSKANNSIQIRKPIKVQINRDSIQIVEIGKGIKTIPLGESTASAVPQLVEQVWKHIDAWGIAGVNSYWKPTLKMYVAPDAASRFTDLQSLLSESGLDVQRAQ